MYPAGTTMNITDTSIIKCLDKYYRGKLPPDGVRFTMSLLSRGKFSPDYKARCIIKILYLEDTLLQENITSDGWNAIQSGF